MARETNSGFISELERRLGTLRKLPDSQSLFETISGRERVYVRYSRLHAGDKTFYGLRARDLRTLEGRVGFIALLWDDQPAPLLIPYSDFEDVFHNTSPASDGQYKSQVLLARGIAELYVAGAGRFNVEGYWGWDKLTQAAQSVSAPIGAPLTHSQVQTVLGAIGDRKGYDIWVPPVDRPALDWSVAHHFRCREELPGSYTSVVDILREVDVLWFGRGSPELADLFEVEHSTPINSGLLRFNDVHLAVPRADASFSIVANETRGAAFLRQIRRPTFRASGLSERCSFLRYEDVSAWYARLRNAS